MKKKLALLFCVFYLSKCFAADFYISNAGSDGANGTTTGTAWKTLARLNIALANFTITDNDHIFFRKGDTFRGTIAWLQYQGSLTFDSYGTGALPVIKGSAIVSGWTNYSGNIWKATVPNKVLFLYANSMPQILARTPNVGTFNLSSYTTNSITGNQIGASGQNFVGANLCLRQYDWQLYRSPVTSQSGNTVNWATGVDISNPGANFYFDNKLSLLDANNEWFYDDATSILYYQSSVNPNTLTIEASINANGIDGSNNRSGNIIRNLQFEHFADAAISLPGTTTNNVISTNVFKNNYTGVSIGGKFTGTALEANLINNNTFDGHYGESIYMSNTANSTVSNNTVLNTGLAFGKHRPDFKGEFYSTGIKVINARIGTTISGNTITNSGNNGIRFYGPGVTVEKNVLENVLLNMSDGGAIYTVGTESSNGIIRQNFIKNVPGDHNGVPGGIAIGIYLDNNVSSTLIDGNTVENVDGGILINAQTHDNIINNNVIYKTQSAITFADWAATPAITGNTMNGNTFYANISGGAPILVQSNYNRYNVLTSSNNNFLINPFGTTVVERKWSNPAVYTLAQWQSLSGFDAASVGSFYNWTTQPDRSFLVKNATSSPVTTSYTNTVDLNNNPVVSLTLPPYSSKVLIDVGTTIWNGTSWSMGIPNATKDAIVDGVYNGAAFEAKSLLVNATRTLTINSALKATNVTNNGAIIVNNNASFIQTPAGIYSGSGTFTVNRTSVSPVNKYAFWSSPVASQNMFTIFPGYTPAFVMTYNTSTNFYDALSNPANSIAGTGYSIKTPASAPNIKFLGAPNNGPISLLLSTSKDKYNLVGNPYPSNLDLAAFYAANSSKISSTLWFWDNTGGTVTTQSGNTASNFGYATYNAASLTWLKAPNGSPAPTGSIAKIGQAFIVEATSSPLSFDNTLRVGSTGVNFNKGNSASNEGKFWLTLSTSYNANVTQAITYQDGASNDFDAYDSKAFALGSDAFYSFAGTEKVVIQGKSLFDNKDVVVLGNKHFENGTFKIELTQKEGLFANGQAVYLKDKLLGTDTNLQDGGYTFTSNAGESTDRFEIVYKQPTLAIATAIKADITVYRNGPDFVIDSPSKIEYVEVYDASGKLIQSFKTNAAKQTVRNLERGVFIFKIKTVTELVSKKVVN